MSSRVSVEKKNAIVPCSGHPVADADEEQVRKAHLAMSKISATANTVTPFRTDPYNYSSYMASESNKIALTHGLSEKQHRQLVLDTIPSLSSAHRFFARSADLTDLFLMISTSATSSLIRTDLEKAINACKLDNSSQDALFTSIMDLHSLLDRKREDYHQQDACEPTLFKQIISRITQQPDLPNFIRESLQQARMRIRQTDRVSELYTSLIAAYNKYVGMKSRYPQNKSIKIRIYLGSRLRKFPGSWPRARERQRSWQGQCHEHHTGLGRPVHESRTWPWPRWSWWRKWRRIQTEFCQAMARREDIPQQVRQPGVQGI